MSRHVAFIIIALAISAFFTYKEYVLDVFTNIKSVKVKCNEVFLYAAIGMFPDLWQGFLQGTIKALGI